MGHVEILYDRLNSMKKDCLTSYSLTKQKDVWGFQNNEECSLHAPDFQESSIRGFVAVPLDSASYTNAFRQYHVFESNIGPCPETYA